LPGVQAVLLFNREGYQAPLPSADSRSALILSCCLRHPDRDSLKSFRISSLVEVSIR
jgi:hypothetical protein